MAATRALPRFTAPITASTLRPLRTTRGTVREQAVRERCDTEVNLFPDL